VEKKENSPKKGDRAADAGRSLDSGGGGGNRWEVGWCFGARQKILREGEGWSEAESA